MARTKSGSKEETKTLNVILPKEKHEMLQEIAKKTGTTVSSMVRMILNQKIAEYEKTGDFRVFL